MFILSFHSLQGKMYVFENVDTHAYRCFAFVMNVPGLGFIMAADRFCYAAVIGCSSDDVFAVEFS